MKVTYFGGSDEDWAKFWLKRTGWKPTDVAKRIAEEHAPGKMVIADIGGGHGRDTYGCPKRVSTPSYLSLIDIP